MKITKSQLKQIIKEELNEMKPLALRMADRRRQQKHRDPGYGNLTIDDVKMVLQKLDMPQYAANLVWEKFNHLNGPEELEQVLAQGFPNLEEAIEIGGETLSFSRPPEPAKEILKQVAQRLSEIQDIDDITEDQAMDVLDRSN